MDTAPVGFVHYSTQASVQAALNEIDAKGVEWFFNTAVETQNKTGDLPNIDSLILHLSYVEQLNYRGFILTLIGTNEHLTVGMHELRSEFQPDGTLINN